MRTALACRLSKITCPALPVLPFGTLLLRASAGCADSSCMVLPADACSRFAFTEICKSSRLRMPSDSWMLLAPHAQA